MNLLNIFKLIVAARVGFLDFEESVRSSKVLQGQENIGLVSALNGYDTRNCSRNVEMPSIVNRTSEMMGKHNFTEFTRTKPFTTYTAFLESNRFPRVLQGQEICSLRFLSGKSDAKLSAWGKATGYDVLNMHQRSKTNFYPLASEGTRNIYFPFNDASKAVDNHNIVTSTNILKENVLLSPSFNQSGVTSHEAKKLNSSKEPWSECIISSSPKYKVNSKIEKDGSLNSTVTDCKLFGFSLTGETSTANSQCSCKRICTKVSMDIQLTTHSIVLLPWSFADFANIDRRSIKKETWLEDPLISQS